MITNIKAKYNLNNTVNPEQLIFDKFDKYFYEFSFDKCLINLKPIKHSEQTFPLFNYISTGLIEELNNNINISNCNPYEIIINSFSYSGKFEIEFEKVDFVYSIFNKSNESKINKIDTKIIFANSEYNNFLNDISVEFNFPTANPKILELTLHVKRIDNNIIESLFKSKLDADRNNTNGSLFEKYNIINKQKNSNYKTSLSQNINTNINSGKTNLTLADLTESNFPHILCEYLSVYLNKICFDDTYLFKAVNLNSKDILIAIDFIGKGNIQKTINTLKQNQQKYSKASYANALKNLLDVQNNIKSLGNNIFDKENIITNISNGMFRYTNNYCNHMVYEYGI